MNTGKIVLIEGMSTSGKTTVMQIVFRLLQEKDIPCKGFDELQTMSRDVFSHLDPKKSIIEMQLFLKREYSGKDTVLICDRFHISHLVITNGTLADFQKIEDCLKEYNPLVVFLEIPEEKVRERLLGAKAHRGQQWEDELSKRGANEEESIKWFLNTQHKLHALFLQSNLEKLVFNTGDNDFERIGLSIVDAILPKSPV